MTLALLIILGALAVADVFVTLRATKRPDLYEASRILRWLMGFGKVWIAVKLVVVAVAGVVLSQWPPVLGIAVGAAAVVVGNNWRLVR